MKELAASFQTLHQFVAAARDRLDPNIWDYLIGGSETETTMRRNRLAIDNLALRPRVLRNVSKRETGREFLGKPARLPLMLSPVGSLDSFYPEGSVAAAQGAAEFGVPVCVSIVNDDVLERAASVQAGTKILQLYTRGDDAWIDNRIQRGIASGYDAVCLTLDNVVPSRRERDIVKSFVKPWRIKETETDYQASFTWDDLERLLSRHKIRFILKGIATAEDAGRACEAGVEAVYISNHGGRQLDQGRGSTEVLPEVVSAVAGRAKVIIDGGYSRGTDILKAIAMGADMVAMGRTYLYGLATAGSSGVVRVLEILEHEVATSMGLLGISSLSELDSSYVCASPPVCWPGVHSAFPLLDEPAPRGDAIVPVAG